MKVAYIIPGTGGQFYCENCLRDLALVTALKSLGHEVVTIPMYLPLSLDGSVSTESPIFYGAINLYLEERHPFFRKAPRWVSRLFDSPGLLKWAARMSGSTRAEGLGELTISMLEGERGHQVRELRELVTFLAKEVRPDVVHLSNALLMGLAEPINGELRVPVVCSLQDEHTWVDVLDKRSAAAVWDLMRRQAGFVERFTPVSRYYAAYMRERLGVPADRIRVVPIGIPLAGYRNTDLSPERPVVGYLSRLTESQGLGLLVDSFLRLKRDPRHRSLGLKLMGGMTGADHRFLKRIKGKLAKAGHMGDVEFLTDFDLFSRQRMLSSLTLLSVPAHTVQASGTFLLEALASGVPVVQPDVGGFTEIVEKTGGGLLYGPNTAEHLSQAIASLLADKSRIVDMSRAGRKAVQERYDIRRMAGELACVYEECNAIPIEGQRPGR
jgi:glycosyltransferase involved in cell wall biosynthesis